MKLKSSLLSLFILCLAIFSLSGCKSKEPAAPDGWGSLSETEESSGLSGGKEIDVETSESSSSSDDKFSIEGDSEASNIGKSEEEIIESKVSKEQESYENTSVYYSDIQKSYVDSNTVFGRQGVLNYISDVGIDNIREIYTQKEFEKAMSSMFENVTDEELKDIANNLYGNDEQKKTLESEMEHSGDGWVLTDEGWVDVYAETNGTSVHISDDDTEFKYDSSGLDTLDEVGIVVY